MPEYRTFKSLQSELGNKKAEYAAEFEYYSEVTRAYNELVSRKEDIAKIDQALPVASNFGSLVYYFQNQATQNGLIIKNLFLAKSAPVISKTETGAAIKSNINNIVFSLNLLGSYSSLENFLVSLEQSAKLFEITSISFGTQSQGFGASSQTQFQGQQTYNFSLEVQTHSY